MKEARFRERRKVMVKGNRENALRERRNRSLVERMRRSGEKAKILPGFITERELLKRLCLKPVQLDYLRRGKGLPYLEVTTKTRLYVEEEVTRWLLDQGKQRTPA